uniref:Chemokine interleukin-8-like domain-containing protein n=1 Tax=Cynoglossus semilaevis TaxID=244447 RepID=A0A3P8UER3_CYNSE
TDNSLSLSLSVCVVKCVLVFFPGRGPTTRVVRPCCTAVSSADVSADVIGVPSQQRARGSCVKALVFLTAKGFVCVNPEAAWAQRRKFIVWRVSTRFHYS